MDGGGERASIVGAALAGGETAPGGAAAWRALAGAQDFDAAAAAWAPIAAAMVERAVAVAVMRVRSDGGGLRVAAAWPASRLPGSDMIAAVETAVAQRRGVARSMEAGATALAYPLLIDPPGGGDPVAGNAEAAVVVEIGAGDPQAVRRAMRQVQWGAAALRDALRAEAAALERLRYQGAGAALHVIVAAAEHEDFETASRAAATDLAIRFDCDRVSIGFRRRGRSRVRAISHSAQFGRRMNLTRLLSAAMDEAVDQQAVILHPDADGDALLAAGAAAALARAEGAGRVLTVPLFATDRYIGAAVFERPLDRPFAGADLATLEAAVTALAPVLEEKRRNSRYLVTQALDVAAAHLGRLLGPGRLARKLAVIAALAVAAFCYLATGTYRVTADATVEGAVQRTISAPFDGFIAEGPARAGDEVREGGLLARLDDRDLALERLRIVTEQRRGLLEYERAVAERDRAEARIKQAQIDQSAAELELIDAQISRAVLRAPFDGVVVSGDLSQSIGASVALGEPLFEIAPLDRYRVVLLVEEGAVANVVEGQQGALVVSALPSETFAISVEKITPVAVYKEGRTTFEVEAAIVGGSGRLRPGMAGAARIDVDERRRIVIWTQPLIDWLRLWSWRWLDW